MTASCQKDCALAKLDAVSRSPLTVNWEMARASDARTPETLHDLKFMPAQMPGTAASVLRQHGAWQPGAGMNPDAEEFWFRCLFDSNPARPDEEVALEIGGIATLSEVWFNGEPILKSSSMFTQHRVDVSSLVRHRNELLIVCRALTTAMRPLRTQLPRTRWRTRVVSEQQLRWFRTTLLGRAPGFAPEPPCVGPWRPVTLVRRQHVVVENLSRQVSIEGTTGVVRAELRIRMLRPNINPAAGWLRSGEHRAPIQWDRAEQGQFTGRVVLRIPDVRLWWPHTHGESSLYPAQFVIELADGSNVEFDDVPVGFRSLEFDAAPSKKTGKAGFSINGVHVFCRGVVWTPPDVIAWTSGEDVLRQRLGLMRDAGFNLIRLAGTTAYESDTFHRLCDELGLFIWQDMMFANMDYPFADPAFLTIVQAEAEAELSRLAKHPSSAMICGNSEIEQQVGMLGMDAALGRGAFFAEELPCIAKRCAPGLPYIPSAPSGGDLPFRTRHGVSNYFGVGAYLRPFEDARRAEVLFASECLAFSNIPEPETIDRIAMRSAGGLSLVHPEWKRAIPRDAGASWDFEDVRDHYLKLLYQVDPAALRRGDAARYLELSRMVSGEAMAEVFGEWRRRDSSCGGGSLLFCADLELGAGWGIVDSGDNPKAAWWFLKRALAPCTVWTTDEGLNGIDIHVANDGAETMNATLRVAMYLHGGQKTEEAETELIIEPHGSATFGLEQMLGRFVDASCAYGFGPPRHDLICVSLHRQKGDIPIAQAFRFPAGRCSGRVPISELGISAQATQLEDGSIEVLLGCLRFANGVRVSAANTFADDAYFGIEPGTCRKVIVTPTTSGLPPSTLYLTAVNAEGRVPIPVRGGA